VQVDTDLSGAYFCSGSSGPLYGKHAYLEGTLSGDDRTSKVCGFPQFVCGDSILDGWRPLH